jgi:mono/diheme cytochrome c family protein
MTRFALVVVLLSACGKNQSPPPPTSGSPNAKPESAPSKRGQQPANDEPSAAEVTFGQICAACHGMGGMGDGPGAATLNPKPRNYTDPAWQASITDQQIKDTIVKGGLAMGKSAMMPAQPKFADQPELLDGLVKIIRGFKK